MKRRPRKPFTAEMRQLQSIATEKLEQYATRKEAHLMREAQALIAESVKIDERRAS